MFKNNSDVTNMFRHYVTTVLCMVAYLHYIHTTGDIIDVNSIKSFQDIERQIDPLDNDYTVRLANCSVNKESKLAGRLEMYYRDQWGTICGDSFNIEAVRVACYSLGYKKTRSIHLYNTFSGDEGKVSILRGINCTGHERHLDQCTRSEYNSDGFTECKHDQDVSIACDPEDRLQPGYQIALIGGPVHTKGILMIRYNQTWGTVCNFRFTDVEATVACRYIYANQTDQFNITGRYEKPHSYPYERVNNTVPIWLGWVECTGEENNLGNCPHAAWGKHTCDHASDVAINCSAAPYDDKELDSYSESEWEAKTFWDNAFHVPQEKTKKRLNNN